MDDLKNRIIQALQRPAQQKEDAFLVCSATELMEQLGFEKWPLLITMKHLRNITSEPDPQHPSRHGVPVEVIAALPEDLNDPTLAFAGHHGAYAFLVDKYVQNNPVAVIVDPHGKAVISSRIQQANFILSIYPLEQLVDWIERLRPEDIVYANRTRARAMLAARGIPFSHLAAKLVGSGYYFGRIGRKSKEGKTYMRSISVGDLIYSAVKIDDVGRRFLVIEVDDAQNIKAIPIDVGDTPSAASVLLRKIKNLKSLTADLSTEVTMSAAWPWIRQPVHLSDSELRELVQTKEEYGKDHPPKVIHADQPVEPMPDFDQGIVDMYEKFREDPEMLQEYLDFSSRFYTFSQRNRMLIYLQNRYATFVASKAGWQEKGYKILPEQQRRGLQIFRPIEKEYINREGKFVPLSAATAQEQYQIAANELEVVRRTTFVPYPVYDIAQTNCPVEDYPKVYDKGTASVDHDLLYKAVERVAVLEGISVTKEPLISISLDGYYDKVENSIHINNLAKDTVAASTILHEYSHALLHCTSAPELPKEVKEFEAQGMAVMLLKHYGFSVSQQDQKYLVDYLSRATMCKDFDLGKSLTRMGQQFRHTVERIDEQRAYATEQQRTVRPEPARMEQIQSNFLKDL